MIETFGHNQPNPILHYDNNPVPMTEDGKIDMPYLKALVALQPQKYGISTWLHKTGVYKYAAEHNLSEGVSEAIRTGDIVKTMGHESEQKYHDAVWKIAGLIVALETDKKISVPRRLWFTMAFAPVKLFR